jgi:hypothetical protein
LPPDKSGTNGGRLGMFNQRSNTPPSLLSICFFCQFWEWFKDHDFLQGRETHFLSSSKDDKLTSFQAARTRNSLPFKQQGRETHLLSSSKDEKRTSFQAARTINSLPFKQQGRETHFLSSSKDEKLTSFQAARTRNSRHSIIIFTRFAHNQHLIINNWEQVNINRASLEYS